MCSLPITPPDLNLENTDAEKLLSTQNASLLLHLKPSISERLQLVKVFAVKGRSQAALREIAVALKFTSLKNRPLALYEIATLLGSMKMNKLVLYCCYEAKEQLKLAPSNKALAASFDELIRQITQEKKNPFQEQADKLDALRRCTQNEKILLEKLTTLLGDYKIINQNSYASKVVKWYNQFLGIDLKLQHIRDGANCTFLEREYIAKQLILNISESMTSSVFYRDILNAVELEDNMKLVRYGLSIPNSEGELIENLCNLTDLLRIQKKKKDDTQKMISMHSFAIQSHYIKALRSYYDGDMNKALGIFQNITEFTLLWFLDYHKKSKLSRTERELQFFVETLSIKVSLSSACFMLTCLLKMLKEGDLKEELKKYKSILGLISKTINGMRYWSSKVGCNFNYAECYTAIGKTQELLAVLKSKGINQHNESTSRKLKLDKTHLENAISGYQNALRFISKDDPAKVRLYKRIIWAVLAHGGIKMTAFFALKFMADLASLESDCSLISHEDQTILNEDYFSLDYDSEGSTSALVSLIYHQRTSLISICQATDCKECCGYHTFLPQFLLSKDCTEMVSETEFGQEASSTIKSSFRSILKPDIRAETVNGLKFTDEVMESAGLDKMSERDESRRIANFISMYCTCKCR